MAWLTQDQHYGEGFYSLQVNSQAHPKRLSLALPVYLPVSLPPPVSQDTVLTLEAVTEYSRVGSRAVLNQDINIRYRSKGSLRRAQLSQSRPVATPIQVRVRQVAPLLWSCLPAPLDVYLFLPR